MKKQLILGLSVVILVVVGFFVFKTVYIPTSEYFSLMGKERVHNFPSIVVEADRAKVFAQIKAIPTYSDIDEYQKLLAIAQNYAVLGEGKRAYKTLMEAIELKPEKSTAFNMLGNLLVSMKAYNSARNAFEIAVKKESAIYTNHAALATFLRDYFPFDKDAITSVYKNGLVATGDHLNLLKDNAAWLEEIGDIKGAIELWQKVYENGGYDTAVRDRINALRQQL